MHPIRRVRSRSTLYGNAISQYAISVENLVPVKAGTVGIIFDDYWDEDARAMIAVVRFPDGVFVNVNRNALDDIEEL